MEIEEFYSSFGPDVVKEVQYQIQMEGGLSRILDRLGAASMPGAQGQHMALQGFLYRFGTVIFLKASRSNISKEEIERLKADKLMRRVVLSSTPTQAKAMADDATQPLRPVDKIKPIPLGKPASPAQSPAADATAAAESQNIAAGAAQEVQPAVATDGPLPGTIVTSTYVGPDRRSGKDRRKAHYGRRMRLENARVERRNPGNRDRRGVPRREADRKALEERQKLLGGFLKKR